MTDINVTARRIKKGSKTYIEVSGLGDGRDATVLLGGKRAERAVAVIVCERRALAADDPLRGDYFTFDRFPDYGKHPLHAVGLRADLAKARGEAAAIRTPSVKANRSRYLSDSSNARQQEWKRSVTYSAAIEILD